ncbi:radical SAM protein [Helicobacter sp. MIT 05-5294]|uniref:radical SAM protein n=1 Tax=Helicobacter sp. MIT 05-5294 TaxID=1548150 RepID=UPI0010FF0FB9|nr:radical SAM protein [Helicobacter sp. MIT 05-5294]TLD88696.1 4Fe-4S cluster-binding domain-containing protein [Helicobacter sp. MIT 05-5294]
MKISTPTPLSLFLAFKLKFQRYRRNLLLKSKYVGFMRRLTPAPFIKKLDVNLAEHCNLNCFSCDHFSQLAKPTLLDPKTYEQDIALLSQITQGLIGKIVLLGGEPLLNPNCKDFFGITRKYFPNSQIILVTNGILLPKQDEEFWQECQKNAIKISPTRYPIKVDWDTAKSKCKQYGIDFAFYNGESKKKESIKMVLNTKGTSDPFLNYLNCTQYDCVQLKNVNGESRIYHCSFSGHIEHFNQKFNQNLQITSQDYIALTPNTAYREILDFLSRPIPFCRYCDTTKWQHIGEWRTSKKDISEYTE